jgi:hypothetical protein
VGRLAHVELHRHAAVDEHAVAAVRQVQRNRLVRPVALAAERVEVPHQRALAALVEPGELLPQADEPLQGGRDETLVVGRHFAVGQGAAERQGADPAADVALAAILFQQRLPGRVDEPQVPRIERDLRRDRTGGDPQGAVTDLDPGREHRGTYERDRSRAAGAGVGFGRQAYPEHTVAGRSDLHDQRRPVGGGALERDTTGVGTEHLGPGQNGRAGVSRPAYGQVGRVGDERLERNQGRAIGHALVFLLT